MRTLSRLSHAAALAGVLLLTGCMAMAPKVDIAEPVQARPLPQTYAPAQSGAIFQSAGYRPLYETHRARMVGDIVTIVIRESITAKQESSSSIEKSGSISGSVSALPFVPGTSSLLGKLAVGGSSNNTFDGTGSSEASNLFNGTIATTVTEVLPNGHLLVAGEKQIGVGQSVDILRFSGQVDPMTIQPGNSVSSAQVANVRVEQTGRGARQEAMGIGWLARFFLSVIPF